MAIKLFSSNKPKKKNDICFFQTSVSLHVIYMCDSIPKKIFFFSFLVCEKRYTACPYVTSNFLLFRFSILSKFFTNKMISYLPQVIYNLWYPSIPKPISGLLCLFDKTQNLKSRKFLKHLEIAIELFSSSKPKKKKNFFQASVSLHLYKHLSML